MVIERIDRTSAISRALREPVGKVVYELFKSSKCGIIIFNGFGTEVMELVADLISDRKQ